MKRKLKDLEEERAPSMPAEDEEEEDYMSMALPEIAKPKETSLQRAERLRRESAARGKVKSKKQLAEEQAEALQKALDTALPSSNKGAILMAKMGYKDGATLGKAPDAKIEPIKIEVKAGKGGIGMESEKKRKLTERMQQAMKAKGLDKVEFVKEGPAEFTERMRFEREEKRTTSLVHDAQKVLERLETDLDEKLDREVFVALSSGDESLGTPTAHAKPAPSKTVSTPLKSVHVLWRGLAKHRLERDRDRKMRHEMQKLVSGLPTYDDADEDDDDKLALSRTIDDIDDYDPELASFEILSPKEQLDQIVDYMRKVHTYCFWCKHQYTEANLAECPGVSEDLHP